MSITLTALMKQRYDTAANWTAQNPTLLAGEFGIESDTKRWKVGTGSTAWTSLLYSNGGTYPLVNADIAAGAAIVDTKLATIATAGKVSNSATTAASANTASAIVARDASGNFTAGTITAALTGAASSNVLKAGDTMTGVLAVTAGTAAAPSIAFDSNTGIYSPGADQVAISTAGSGRLFVDSAGRVGVNKTPGAGAGLNQRVQIKQTGDVYDGLQIEKFDDDSFLSTGVFNSIWTINASYGTTGSYLPVRLFTGGSERARIDSSGRLLVGTSSYTGNGKVAIAGGNGTNIALLDLRYNSTRPTAADTALVEIRFGAADQTSNNSYAKIEAVTDGASTSDGDLPGRLVFSTTADGAASPTEALRITNDRVLAYNQPAPATYAAAATLTVADLKTGIITYTGANATLTLPTGTLTEGGFAGIYTNMAFEWSVINTGGAGNCTIGAGTAHTIIGSATVTIGTSGRFVSRRTAANTFVSYRLS